jgi:hypothetical protein
LFGEGRGVHESGMRTAIMGLRSTFRLTSREAKNLSAL